MSARVTALAAELRDELAQLDEALQAVDVAGLLIPREFVAALQRARNIAKLAHQRSLGVHQAAVADDGGAHMAQLVEWLLREGGRTVALTHERGATWTARFETECDPTWTAPDPEARQVTAANCPGLGNAVETALATWAAGAAREAAAGEPGVHDDEPRPWPWAD